jgi:hypothetical protein
MKRIGSLLLLVACLGCGGSGGSTLAGDGAPVVDVARAETKAFPLPVIELNGDGANIGAAHGTALNGPIHELFEKYLAAQFTSPTRKFVALTAARGFEAQLLPEHRAEVEGLASSTGLPHGDVMLAQCFLDLLPMTACSTVSFPAGASADGVARMGRNLDFPTLNVADKHSVVMVYRPTGKYQFAAVSWPGMMGVLSGMNEHGLTLANMELSRGQRLPSAMPYTLLYRTVLEKCKTVDEAIDYLKRTPRQSSNNLMLMDAAGNRAVVELSPEEVVVRRGMEHQALISTNHRRGEDQDTPGRCWRYDWLHKAGAEQFGSVTEKSVEKMLADVKQGKSTMQSMVFEPSNRVVYLATGQNAPLNEFHRLDLTEYFGAGK